MGGFDPAVSFTQPGFLRFGPDGRLYVTTYTGSLYAITLDSKNEVTAVQEYKLFGNRLLSGIAFDPDSTESDPIIYVANNAPPMYGAADFTSRVSRIDDLEAGLVTDIIDGLPRSAENHMTFDLEFGSDGRLYICQGGNTNNGAPWPGLFGNRPESRLSAALLVADVRDPDFSGLDDVELYVPGLRNTYGMCLHSNGMFYGIDQGANAGFGLGGRPNPDGTVTAVTSERPDEINVLLPGRYYGHPNPARGEYAFHEDLPNGTPYQPPLRIFPAGVIVTSVAEYTSSANGGLLEGRLLMPAFIGGGLWYASLSPNGMAVTDLQPLTGNFANPLDVAVGPDGTIYILEAGGTLKFGGSGPARITVLQPHAP